MSDAISYIVLPMLVGYIFGYVCTITWAYFYLSSSKCKTCGVKCYQQWFWESGFCSHECWKDYRAKEVRDE